LNIFIALIEEAYVNSRMEQKSHWVFDYIRYSDKKNQKEILEKSIFDEKENQNHKHDLKIKEDINSKYDKYQDLNKNHPILEKDSTHGKYFSVKEFPFSINIDSQKNSSQPKSLNLRGLERGYEKELNSLSYKKDFEILSFNNEEKSFKLVDHNLQNINNINSYSNFNPINLKEVNKDKDTNFSTNYLISPSSRNLNYHSNLKKKPILDNNIENNQKSNEITKNLKEKEIKSDKTPLRLNLLESPSIKKRVNFNLELPKEERKRISINEAEIISEERNQIISNILNSESTLKKDDFNKSNKNKSQKGIENKSFVSNLKKEVEKEFENIFEDLNLIDKHSKQTLNKLPSYMIDDLRLMILDLTNSLDHKKNQIEDVLNQ
jgi:hypothetical protein